MRVFGLVGFPLDHSWSPAYFKKKFDELKLRDTTYKLFPLENLSDFSSLLTANPGICGLNVTLPHKNKILPLLDILDPLAKETGAVNTIAVSSTSGKTTTKGYNTDVTGFEFSLLPRLKSSVNKALVLGNGGASRSVCYILKKHHIPFVQAARTPLAPDQLNLDQLEGYDFTEITLIINTTSAGQYPQLGNPLPRQLFSRIGRHQFLFDLVYNPPETEFLELGRKAGATIVNGHEMLVIQADEAWKIWNREFIIDN
ncbi:MAG: shikimate dehydrogenase [Bacteroidetes bacterium]|nr:shikimate dehydrogenase [Bacteroidota bacterium]